MDRYEKLLLGELSDALEGAAEELGIAPWLLLRVAVSFLLDHDRAQITEQVGQYLLQASNQKRKEEE